MPQVGDEILRVEGISRNFGGVHALQHVQLDVRYGEVHALVGENGAGKSTLIKVLGGIIPRDAGKIVYEGKEGEYHSPVEAQRAGIAIIHQELSMMPSLSVIENLFMGRMKGPAGIVNWRQLERQTAEALTTVNLVVDPYTPVRDLSISQRQLIEIARVLSTKAKLIIMDEPNSSLSDAETERLFAVIKALKEQGIAIIYVSHKIEEVLRISDRITVLRDGSYVGTVNRADVNEAIVINMMVGRKLDRSAGADSHQIGSTLLEVSNLTSKRFRNVSFSIRCGEILALSGLVGAGRSDVARAIFGADSFQSGNIVFDGRPVRFTSPCDAIQKGMAMVPEDRKVLSLFTSLKIMHNMSLAHLPRMTGLGNINYQRERDLVNDFVRKLDIRLASIQDPVSSLSGGNQQKTVLARWLATSPKLLILDEPTHGVDVGAKTEIYDLIRTLARQGIGILLISSELPEVLALAHRIVTMCEGRVTGIFDRADATEERIMAYATGLADDFAPKGSFDERSA